MFFKEVLSSEKVGTSSQREISFGNPLEQGGHFKSFITHIQINTERIFRSCITNYTQVAMIAQCSFTRIYFTIAIYIKIFQITALPLTIRFEEAKIHRSQIIINFAVAHK